MVRDSKGHLLAVVSILIAFDLGYFASAALSQPRLSVSGTTLSWQTVSGADGYNVYRNNAYLTTIRGSRSYPNAQPGAYYIVAFDDQATGSAKWSPRSNQVTVVSTTTSPPSSGSGGPVCTGAVLFKDDFSGTSIDSAKWEPGLYWGFTNFGTGEKQHYVRSKWDPAFEVRGGSLHIRARWDGSAYLSGALTARSKAQPTFRQGCYEMRAKFPDQGSGTWPALWLIGNSGGLSAGERPELDVIEHTSFSPNLARFAGHYLPPSPGFNQAQHESNLQSPSSWHTYSMRWTDTRIFWYLDGVEVYSAPASLDQPMHLHLNLAIGGWGGQNTISSSLFRNGNQPIMKVDYVKVTT